MNEKNIPVILGPTASGKTKCGIELARLLNAEIISVDSRKVYEGLKIGTATPAGEWRDGVYWVQGIAHHLMGHLKADHPYNAGDFADDAARLIEEILKRGKCPLIVGGTGFYFKALQKGLPVLPKRDEEFRKNLENEMTALGPERIHERLKAIDPVSALGISDKDRHKIIRALEIFHLTGRPFSEWKSRTEKKSHHQFTVLGLDFEKEVLNQRIEVRSKKMFDEGMIEETKNLLDQGYSPECPALVSFGYKEAVQVIQGKIKREDFLPLLIKGTKAYAKRQRTWFRTQITPTWFMCDETSKAAEIALKMSDFLKMTN